MQMQGKDLIQSLLRELKCVVNNLEGVYLFGSRAQKEENAKSDWDFAYLSRTGVQEQKVWEMKTQLEIDFDTSIDVVDLYKANTILQVQVIKTGEIIWAGDLNKIRQFEYLTLSYYQKLNDERAHILADVKRRGSVYG